MSNLGDVLRQVVCTPVDIPDGWAFLNINDLCSPKQWRTISSSEMTSAGFPVFGANGFVGFYHEYNHEFETVAITCRGNTCGTINRIPPKTYITGNSMSLDNIKSSIVYQDYLYYALKYRGVGDSISGSAQPQITGAGLKAIEIPAPPLPEQQKIATILSSVDNVIEKTRAQIDKLKDLKTGMMQELLTKGIGHTEFKDSPVGRIPVGWEVVNLECLLASVDYSMRSGPFGSSLLKHELVEIGVPYLGIDNVHVERFERKFKRFVTTEKYQELSKYAVRENDIMVTIMGTVGRCCVVPKGVGRALSSKHVWAMTFDQEKYCPELICWQINYATWVERQLKNESQGGVMESISSKTLKSLVIPLPPMNEQRKIAEAHSKISKIISKKSKKMMSLMNFKKALMQDLLTGKVRVNVHSEQKEAVAG